MDRWIWWALGLMGAAGAYLATRPFGALQGAVKITSSKPAIGLTWWLSSGNDPQWKSALSSFDFVTVKMLNGTKPMKSSENAPVIAAARDAGVPVHGWSYCNARSPQEGAVEGAAAAQAALELGAAAYWINAEHQWAGGYMGEAGAPDPLAAMTALVQAFRERAPGVILVFNCTTSWISKRLRGLDEPIAALFDAYGPMLYSSGSEGGKNTLRKKWGRGYGTAQAVGIPFTPMIGSGRMDKGGRFWTNLDSVIQIQREQPAQWITAWIAPKQADRLYAANNLNPSLADFAEVIS